MIKIVFKETKFSYLVEVKIRVLWIFWLTRRVGMVSKSIPNAADVALDCYNSAIERIKEQL